MQYRLDFLSKCPDFILSFISGTNAIGLAIRTEILAILWLLYSTQS